jgi:ribosomal protein L7/L12
MRMGWNKKRCKQCGVKGYPDLGQMQPGGLGWLCNDCARQRVADRRARREGPPTPETAGAIDAGYVSGDAVSVTLTMVPTSTTKVIRELRAVTGTDLRTVQNILSSVPVVAVTNMEPSRAHSLEATLTRLGVQVDVHRQSDDSSSDVGTKRTGDHVNEQNPMDQLVALSGLLEAGHVTPEEYAIAKRRLLEQL